MGKSNFIFLLLFISGCASIPKESVQLNQEVGKGITSYHQAYVNLLNDYFAQKRKAVDDFIQNKYLPQYLENIKTQLVSAGEDPNVFDDSMVKDIVFDVTALRDTMQADLENTRIALIEKISSDYMLLQQANSTVTGILQSAVDVKEATSSLNGTIGDLSCGKINFDKLESKFNEYLKSCEDLSSEGVSLFETTKEVFNNQ